ncbi:hypothetical protein ACIQ6Y_09435 [Streptomyces sp. NPDC096205]|uniref:hypothetical protein n=1 Tax=Streptomyces sp. NPDC096205 TaxID=3366081 RepID=UPI00381B7F8D
MSAEREFEHGMTDRDITQLLADAASEVEIGIAPTQALIRGGRRRRARRWAIAAVTAVVVAGSTGALAVTGLPGGEDREVTPATQPPTPRPPLVVEPEQTTLATGTDGGRPWKVVLNVWPAPKDELEAVATLEAMAEFGDFPGDIRRPEDLIGKSAYFLHGGIEKTDRALAGITAGGLTTEADRMSGTDLESVAAPLDRETEHRRRLVIGHVAKTAQEVTCTWKDGSSTVLPKAVAHVTGEHDINGTRGTAETDVPAIRTADGSPYSWFVCLAPQGTAYKSAKVTK